MWVSFLVDARYHGKGSVICQWHPHGMYVASSGISRVVHVFDRQGEVVAEIVPPSASVCIALEWDKDGDKLAILQAHSSIVVVWNRQTKETQRIDTGIKDLTFLKWSKVDAKIAIGTAKGSLIIFDTKTSKKIVWTTSQKKKLLYADWNTKNQVAFVTEDQYLYVCSDMAVATCHLKLGNRPLSVAFGGYNFENANMVSVNLGGKVILLYNTAQKEESLEIEYESRYGSIIAHFGFDKGHIVAGFSNGYLVIISTNPNKIQREMYSKKLYADQMTEMTYNEATRMIATFGDETLKVICMSNWKEVIASQVLKDVGRLGNLSWSSDGCNISLTNDCGNLISLTLDSRRADTTFFCGSSVLFDFLLKPFTPLMMASSLFLVLMSLTLYGVLHFQVTVLELYGAIAGSTVTL